MLIRSFMIILGSAFLLEILVLAFISNYNLGWVLTIFMGIFFIVYGLWFDPINAAMSHGILRIIRYLGYALLAFLFGTILFLACYGHHDTITYQEEAIVVLGAGLRGDRVSLTLKQRLDAAYDYWQENPEAIIVTSGGQGPQETVAEGKAMAEYLAAKGIPKDNLLAETKSTSTAENFRFSQQLLKERFGRDCSIGYVTNAFHIYRAGQIASDEGISATHYHAALSWYMIPVVYFREFAAVIVYWL